MVLEIFGSFVDAAFMPCVRKALASISAVTFRGFSRSLMVFIPSVSASTLTSVHYRHRFDVTLAPLLVHAWNVHLRFVCTSVPDNSFAILTLYVPLFSRPLINLVLRIHVLKISFCRAGLLFFHWSCSF